MMTARITVLAGDGIGPEVAAEGEKVLRAIGARFGHDFTIVHRLIGGAAIDAAGEPLPADTLADCCASDAVLLGAVGGPKWDDVPPSRRPETGLLALRKGMGVYANVRPVVAHPSTLDASPLKREIVEGTDLVVIRELTGGIYFGEKSVRTIDGEEHASDLCTYSTHEIERVVRVAATMARGRRGKVTSVDKANVLETSRLWRRVVTRVMRDEFPDVTCEHVLVDACAMHLVKRPSAFDVIVTENMFGDILTDEASILAGSIGLLPSASIGDAIGVAVSDATGHATGDTTGDAVETTPEGNGSTRRRGLYEPIHGSAPDIAGRGIANPIGTIMSVAMLLRHSLGLDDEARCIEAAVSAALDAGDVTIDVDQTRALPTHRVGDAIVQRLDGVMV